MEDRLILESLETISQGTITTRKRRARLLSRRRCVRLSRKRAKNRVVWLVPLRRYSKILRWMTPSLKQARLRLALASLWSLEMTTLRSFLALETVRPHSYRDFVANMSSLGHCFWRCAAFQYYQQAARTPNWLALPTAAHFLQQHCSAADASEIGAGGLLFQLKDSEVGIPVTKESWPTMSHVTFMSYQFTPTQMRYHTTEREWLAVVKVLAEVRWIVKGSKYPASCTPTIRLIATFISFPIIQASAGLSQVR